MMSPKVVLEDMNIKQNKDTLLAIYKFHILMSFFIRDKILKLYYLNIVKMLTKINVELTETSFFRKFNQKILSEKIIEVYINYVFCTFIYE